MSYLFFRNEDSDDQENYILIESKLQRMYLESSAPAHIQISIVFSMKSLALMLWLHFKSQTIKYTYKVATIFSLCFIEYALIILYQLTAILFTNWVRAQ